MWIKSVLNGNINWTMMGVKSALQHIGPIATGPGRHASALAALNVTDDRSIDQ